MEIVVMTLMVVVCFSYILKQTYRKWSAVFFSATVAALFCVLAWPYAIEQSKTQIADWLSDPALMRDTAVVLSVDVFLQLAFCMLAAHMMTSGRLKNRMVMTYKVLRFIPSILFYPVLFSGLVVLMFSFHGIGFKTLAWCMAGAVFILIPGLTWLMKVLLPEKDLRLELLFLCNIFILFMGVIATVNGQMAVVGNNEVDWGAFLGFTALLLVGALTGMLLWRARQRRLRRKSELEVKQ